MNRIASIKSVKKLKWHLWLPLKRHCNSNEIYLSIFIIRNPEVRSGGLRQPNIATFRNSKTTSILNAPKTLKVDT